MIKASAYFSCLSSYSTFLRGFFGYATFSLPRKSLVDLVGESSAFSSYLFGNLLVASLASALISQPIRKFYKTNNNKAKFIANFVEES